MWWWKIASSHLKWITVNAVDHLLSESQKPAQNNRFVCTEALSSVNYKMTFCWLWLQTFLHYLFVESEFHSVTSSLLWRSDSLTMLKNEMEIKRLKGPNTEHQTISFICLLDPSGFWKRFIPLSNKKSSFHWNYVIATGQGINEGDAEEKKILVSSLCYW